MYLFSQTLLTCQAVKLLLMIKSSDPCVDYDYKKVKKYQTEFIHKPPVIAPRPTKLYFPF